MYEYIHNTLKELCIAAGVGGQRQIADTAIALLKEYTDTVQMDAVGNVIAHLPAEKDSAPVLLLEAHMDEIGFIATAVNDKGFIRVAPCGGVDRRCLAATPVTVWADTPLNGVFCCAVPHLQKEDGDKAPSAEALYVDVGLSADEAKRRVPPGAKISFRSNFSSLSGDCVTSKALDNRAGMASVLYALQLLRGKALPYTIKVLFSCAEELGCRGAVTGAFTTEANAAIVVDVSFAHTPYEKREDCGEMGKGAMLGIAPTLSYSLTAKLQNSLQNRDVIFQTEVIGGKTGTNADVIGTVRAGIPTVLLSIPLKYMHTPVEEVCLSDIKAVGESIAAFVESEVL